jgi:hypothetical protein
MRAAEQLLRSGRIDDGVTILKEVLGELGFGFPSSPRAALASLLIGRARLAVHGRTRFREQDPSEIPPRELLRIDACWSAAEGLGTVDVIRGADFQTRHLLLALRASEPFRLSRALGTEATFIAIAGESKRAEVDRLLAVATALAERIRDDRALGYAVLNRGICAYLRGAWREAQRTLEEADAILRERCTGVAWELSTAQFLVLGAVAYQGEIAQVSSRLPRLIRAATDRGDLYTVIQLRTWLSHWLYLANDDPDGASRVVRAAMELWSHQGYHLQHFQALHAQVQIALYQGDTARAWERVKTELRAAERSMLTRLQLVRVQGRWLRARAALAHAAATRSGRERDELVAAARRDTRSIERERCAWGGAIASMLRAGILDVTGDRAGAAHLYGDAATLLRGVDMRLFAEAARRRAGELRGGDRGRADVDAADRWLEEQEVDRPDRLAAMIVPVSG